jgi:capsular exopolysaccharide synthesis family protein
VSRIFDALRRLEEMGGGVGVETPRVPAAASVSALNALSPGRDGLDKVEKVTSRPRPESHLLGTGERDRVGLERFKLLRYRLYRLREQQTLKSVLVTSAIPKEGKTMVAANLAVALAQASDRVLLVDADLRKPSLHTILGLTPSVGLSDFLQGRVELLRSCRKVDPLGLFFLAAGRSPAHPTELLQSESMRSVMKTAATTFDWMVIDSPPVLPIADGRILASLCDAVLVVAREEYTRREVLQEGLAALKGTCTAGIVLNSSRSASGSAYSYYYPTQATREAKFLAGAGRKTMRGQASSHD